MECRAIVRAPVYRTVTDQEDDDHPAYFALRDPNKLRKEDIGAPLFYEVTRCPNIQGYVPHVDDQKMLSKQEQSWLLVGFPDAPGYVKFAWAALRPPRKSPWERHAQIRSDGYLSPPNFVPK